MIPDLALLHGTAGSDVLYSYSHFDIFENMKKADTPSIPPGEPDVCAVRCFHPQNVERVRQRLNADRSSVSAAAAMFKTLGNVKRLTILRALRVAELCVCDIAHLLGLSVAATSQQLRQLRSQGWIVMRSDGKMVYYRLNEVAPLRELETALRFLGPDRDHATTATSSMARKA